MKTNQFYNQNQNQIVNPVVAAHSLAVTDVKQEEKDFVPSPDEIARKAYFSFMNAGSQPGDHVQHWLAAEAELIAERNRTRVHGFHNRS